MNVLEVYADIWCPFTHVGLKRLVERREAEGTALLLRVHPWPLELVNGAPLDPGFVAEEVEELQAQVAPGLFAGFREDRFPETTLPALALVESAYGADDGLGEATSLRLRDALFELGRDVSDEAVLAEIGADLGVPRPGPAEHDAVRASWERGRDRGVVGSPHFFTRTEDFFCPALDIERVDGHLRISMDQPAFERFLASCFAR